MKTSRTLRPFLVHCSQFAALASGITLWLASSNHAAAQWGHAADLQTPVCAVAGASVFDTRVVSDGAGGLFAVWTDTRNSSTGYDIYAQHLGANGRPLWAANGVEVVRVSSIQELPQLVADGAGGVIVIWHDHRVFNDGRSHLFAQRLDANGSPLWAPNGIRVAASNASQHNAVIAPRAAGGVVVAWHDERNSPNTSLVAQAFDLNGNPQLGDSGIVLTTDTVVLSNLNVVPIAGGDTMVLWRGNFAVVKAVRVSNPANVAEPFPRPALVSGTNSLVAVSDGAGGVVAALYRFSGNTGVWAQRVSSSLQSLWTTNGVLLSTNVSGDAASEVAIASDGSGGAYVAWHTKAAGNNRNLFAQRVAANGATQWASGGVTVASTPEEDEFPALLGDPTGAYILWRHRNSGASDAALRLQRYTLAGTTAWASAADVTSRIPSIEDHGLVTDNAGGVVAGFNVFPLGGSLDVVAKRVLASGGFPQSRLINVSTRAFVGTGDQQLIGGFVVAGTGRKRVLIRGIGPRLGDLGVSGALADPTLSLVNGANVEIANNNNWSQNANAAQIAEIAAHVGAFSLNAGSTDAALLIELDPGAYTAVVGGVGGATGTALVEIYDTDGPNSTSRLVNVASRGFVGTDGNVIIPGFVVTGDATMRVLVRAVGPTLGSFGVAGFVADPRFDFYGPANVMVGSNDNWSSSPTGQSTVIAASQFAGAFPLPVGSRDAGSVPTIGAGSHTVVISGVNSTTGVCLVEGYESF